MTYIRKNTKIKPLLGCEQLSSFVVDCTTLNPSNISNTHAASTEMNDVQILLDRAIKFATGTIANQRSIKITAPTLSFVGASTVTKASTVSISGPPVAGSNATITDAYALEVESGKIKTNDSIVLQNGEYIRNSTDGAIDLMPNGTTATHFGFRVDPVIWGYGPSLYAVRASDGNLTSGAIRFMNSCVINNDIKFALGSTQGSFFQHTLTGLDTLQIAVTSSNASYSGAVAIIKAGTQAQANRSPATSHTNPNLYVFAGSAVSQNDFIRFEHDLTDGRIATGNGQLSLEPATSVFVNSGLRLKRTATATNYTVLITDSIIGVTSTAADRTITLPSATVGAGTQFTIKDESGGAATNNISIASVSSQTFDGAASPLVINTNYGSKNIYSDGANWFTI